MTSSTVVSQAFTNTTLYGIFVFMIERFIELEGPGRGRVEDIGIAFDLAHTEYAWREEGDGKPMLNAPDSVLVL